MATNTWWYLSIGGDELYVQEVTASFLKSMGYSPTKSGAIEFVKDLGEYKNGGVFDSREEAEAFVKKKSEKAKDSEQKNGNENHQKPEEKQQGQAKTVTQNTYRGIQYKVEHPDWLSPYLRDDRYYAYAEVNGRPLETVDYDNVTAAARDIRNQIDEALGPEKPKGNDTNLDNKSKKPPKVGPVAKKATYDANVWTDKKLAELESKISVVFTQAQKEMQKKLDVFMREYERLNIQWQNDVKSGKVKQEQYEAWLKSQTMNRDWIKGMVDRLSSDNMHVEQMSIEIASNALPMIFSENANRAMYGIAKDVGWDSHSFDLYDVTTVRGLINGDICVMPKVDSAKSKRWNEQKFTSAITQSVLQGESIENAAKRLQSVIKMDKEASIRAVRTSITSAQNAGRVESYKRAKDMGIDLEQEWLATPDKRTRETHALLDGQHVPIGSDFIPDGYGSKYAIRYPADPNALGEMIYNCRCTLVAWFEGIENEDPERWTNLPKGMTYEEWRSGYVPNKSEIKTSETDWIGDFSSRFGEIDRLPTMRRGEWTPFERERIQDSLMRTVDAHHMTSDEALRYNREAESAVGVAVCDRMYWAREAIEDKNHAGSAYFGGNSNYWGINCSMRNGKSLTGGDKVTADALNAVTSGVSVLKEDTVLFRWLALDEIALASGADPDFYTFDNSRENYESSLSAAIGKTMVDNGYTSTSFAYAGHEGMCAYRILAREGTPIYARRGAKEREILLGSGIEKHVVGMHLIDYDGTTEDGDEISGVFPVFDIVV